MSAPGSKRAGVGEATERLALHSTLGLPLLKVPQRDSPSGVLHPLDHLEQGVRRSKEEQEEQGGARRSRRARKKRRSRGGEVEC